MPMSKHWQPKTIPLKHLLLILQEVPSGVNFLTSPFHASMDVMGEE